MYVYIPHICMFIHHIYVCLYTTYMYVYTPHICMLIHHIYVCLYIDLLVLKYALNS